jgi:hypothetical protein
VQEEQSAEVAVQDGEKEGLEMKLLKVMTQSDGTVNKEDEDSNLTSEDIDNLLSGSGKGNLFSSV